MAETHQFEAQKLFNLQGYVAVVTGGGNIATTYPRIQC